MEWIFNNVFYIKQKNSNKEENMTRVGISLIKDYIKFMPQQIGMLRKEIINLQLIQIHNNNRYRLLEDM